MTKKTSKLPVRDQKKRENAAAISVSWQQVARLQAREAHVNNFSSRRGIYPLEVSPTKEVLVLYNNNPWAGAPEQRDLETAMFRAWLDKRGVSELAYATYPAAGPSKEYSYAMLLDAPESLVPEVRAAMEGIVKVSLQMGGQGAA